VFHADIPCAMQFLRCFCCDTVLVMLFLCDAVLVMLFLYDAAGVLVMLFFWCFFCDAFL
jgi:hypothetical protein